MLDKVINNYLFYFKYPNSIFIVEGCKNFKVKGYYACHPSDTCRGVVKFMQNILTYRKQQMNLEKIGLRI